MRKDQKAHVYLGDKKAPVGVLRFHSDGKRQHSNFTYLDSWLEHPKAFAISPELPLQQGAFYASGRGGKAEALHGVFSDAAPDSWGRSLMRRALGPDLTEFDYLVNSEDQTRQGALRFLDENGNSLSALKKPLQKTVDIEHLRSLARNYELDPVTYSTGIEDLAAAAGSLGGARPKANAYDNSGLWIAKFTSVFDQKQVERVEVGTLALAKECGITASEARLVLRKTQQPVALIKRFDRNAANARIPYMSARTVLQETGMDGAYYTDLADFMRQHSLKPQKDMEEIWRRMVFSILCHNNDDHLKNHGFLYMGNQRWALSPAFDINPQPDRHSQLKTGISPIHGFDPSIEQAIDASEFFDVSVDRAKEIAGEMSQTITENWRKHMADNELTAKEINEFAKAFEHSEMEYALNLSKPSNDRNM